MPDLRDARMVLPILSLAAVSFAISWIVTLAMKHVAPRIGFVDKPGHRKIHHTPKPFGGGVAIFLGFAVPLVLVVVAAHTTTLVATLEFLWTLVFDPTRAEGSSSQLEHYWGGVQRQTPMVLGILGAMLVMHVMGLIDDRKALGPYTKLIVQLAVVTALVVGFDLRALTALGYVPSIVLTVLWIVAITNAFNFLDNMDGLSAGVAAVAATAFLVAALSIEQWFVAAALALLIGALLGFLCFNFNPATIFMGDSGSLIIGLLLGILTVRTTFLPPGRDWGAGWYVVFAPVIVLAVPLYDLVVVSAIRISRGKSPFVGDTNHFSHRLVARGMSRRTAVLTIYLVTAATSVAAILLPHVTTPLAASLIVLQTALILGVVALLEQHPLPRPETNESAGATLVSPASNVGSGPGDTTVAPTSAPATSAANA